MRALKISLFALTLTLIAAVPAMADTCNAFGSYTCGKSHEGVFLTGTGDNTSANMVVLGSNTFTVSVHNGKFAAGDDLIIIAAAPNGLTGTLNGMSLTPGSFNPANLTNSQVAGITGTWS